MSQNEDTKPATTEESLTGAKALWADVESALSNSAEVVRSRLKDLYVERELQERTSLLEKGLNKVREARNELKKMKPDMKHRDSQGQLVENWSNDAWDKKQKAVEALTKLEKAVDSALSGKYEDLKKLA